MNDGITHETVAALVVIPAIVTLSVDRKMFRIIYLSFIHNADLRGGGISGDSSLSKNMTLL